MSKWAECRLSDVSDVNPRVGALGTDAPFITMADVNEWGHWAAPSGPRGDRGGMRAQGGDVLVARITPCLENGKIAQVPTHFDRVGGSTEFIVLRAKPGLALNTFLYLWAQERTSHEAAVALMVGTSGRKRVSASDLAALPMAAPTLVEQRRIVAVMSAVDLQIAAITQETGIARALLQRVLSEALRGLPSSVSYGTVATTRSGPSWSAEDETKVSVGDSTQVLKITNTKSDGSLDLTDETFVVGLPGSTPTLDASSLIIIRTNGNRGRIGNVYRATPAVYGSAVSAFQFISRAHDQADRDFLYWALREPSMQQRMSEAASGSTGLGNLAVRWLNGADVPWSSDPAQRAGVVERLDSMQAAADRLSAELAALRVVRADLLSAMLSQEIAVNVAVDKFVKAV